MRLLLVFISLLSTVNIRAQCELTITGWVTDHHNDESLEYANVLIRESGQGSTSDSTGYFEIGGICPGEYHVTVSHIGCTPEEVLIRISKDTSITVYLEHHSEMIHEVIVEGKSSLNSHTEEKKEISEVQIRQNTGLSLAELSATISGVSSLKNGSGLAKPVIHGLYGNRVVVLNQGMQQAGQQWGNDHAPEIDPNSVNQISVIKGASALRYGSSAIGGVLSVSSAAIPLEPHLHGHARYAYQSNGRGHLINTSIYQGKEKWKWRLNATYNLRGDVSAPDYYLTNTGKDEKSILLQLEHTLSAKTTVDGVFSYYDVNQGILRGSHIGNLTDLNDAIIRDVPFYTADSFSYSINAPRQKVNHTLSKINLLHFFNDNQYLRINYGNQINNRAEYDVRRGNRSDRPVLNLKMIANNLDLSYHHESDLHKWTIGLQNAHRDNTNNPGTGIIPLIPNYRMIQTSPYLIWEREVADVEIEAGIRSDIRRLQVARIDPVDNDNILRSVDHYYNYAASLGAKYHPSHAYDILLSMNLAKRAPEVNELYSFGLHQGVAGIEEGNENLNSEQSIKALITQHIDIKDKVWIELSSYYQHIRDYIYLNPQSEPRLTIRGAFPVFKYEQTNARIYGLDGSIAASISDRWSAHMGYAMVRGTDLTNDTYLVFMPQDNVNLSIKSYVSNDIIKNGSIAITPSYHWRQNRLTTEQDFLVPPDGYFLIDMSVNTDLSIGKSNWNASLTISNLMNTSYRNYLNRLRYYADDEGRNVRLVLQYNF